MSDRPQETFDALTMPLDGAHSIAASAGTGKTFTIATLYLRYLLEWSCPVEQILVTTYTEAATAELTERLRARLHEAYRTICHPDAAASGHRDDDTVPRLLAIAGAASSAERLRDRLEAALLDYDRAPIYTIHGFCHRVLRDLVFETASRFDPELITTQVPMVDDAVFDFAARHWAEDDAVLARALPLRDHLEAMRKVATLATEHPGYPIVPAADVTALTAAPDGAADEALSSLRDAWQADGEEACALLYESFEKGHLSKTQYGHTRERIDETVAFIDDLVRSMSLNRFDPGSPASQRRLAQDVIIGGTLKKHQNDAARHPVFLAVQRVVEAVGRMHAGYEKRRIRMLAALGTDVRRRVRQVKEERGQVSFGDLLHQVDDALGGPGRATLIDVLRGRYRVALVDEFQDTDPVQYRIFRRAFHDAARDAATPRAFIMIGDPKQSIYRFRGADIHSYLHATDRRTTPHQHTMDRNWRSDGSLVDAVQAVFRTQDDPFRDRGIPLPKVHSENPDRFAGDPALEVVFVDRDARFGQGRAPGQDRVMGRIANVVAADIVQRLNGDHAYGEAIQPADFAVLCRTGNQLRRMQRALADRRVPVVLHSDESVYDTTEAQDMLRVLAALIDPNGAGRMVDALLTPVFGCGAETLLHLEQDDQERSRRARQLHELRDVWRRRGFMVAWRRLIENAETVPRLAAEITGERRITNYLHLAELLHREESIRHAGPEQLHRWLEQSVADGQRGAELESQLRLETDAEAVQLCTIHHSKGLEYPIVFCPTLWHHYGGHKTPKVVMARKDADGEPIEIPEIDVGSDDFDERVTADRAESDAEDRRLLYVALTRAKHQCIVHWTAATSAHKTALGEFMLEDVGGKTEDARIATSIERWCASRACPGLSTRRVSSALPSTAHYEPTPRPARPLAARRIDRTAVSALARTSFTSLVRSASTLDEPADLDDAATTPTRVPAPADQSLFTLPLADMPSGRRIGELAHRVLEESLDGGRAHGAGLDAATTIVAERLDRHLPRVGLDPAWHDPLAHALATCLTGALPLGGITCRLVDLPPSDLACELHFTLRAGDAGRSFDTSALARALARAERPVVRDYARRAERLETRRIRGLLEGFIDLAFEWDGRWYVVDYKTNLLGPHPEHYSTACLDAVMSEHDYILQCHLYAVALDRMLAQRVRDYDYERDFGGVAYLFVRGFEPGEDPDRGVWFDRPPRAVIDALHAALDGGSAG